MPVLLKYLITAGLIVVISEIAKRSDKLGAFIGALPLVTSLAMIWMFFELSGQQQVDKIGNHAWYTFWYVLPTLPVFLVIPWMLKKGIHFGWVMAAYCVGTFILFLVLHFVLKKFGMPLI